MSKKHICPSCGSALQEAAYHGEVFYACTCGHGKPILAPTETKGVVAYMQEIGNKTLTQILPVPQDD